MKQENYTSLPPSLAAVLAKAESIAHDQHMPVDDLLRRALDSYLSTVWLDEANAYGRRKAAEMGITEDDVERLVHEFRHEQQEASKN